MPDNAGSAEDPQASDVQNVLRVFFLIQKFSAVKLPAPVGTVQFNGPSDQKTDYADGNARI
jgi:hypothetical protein